MLKLRKKIAKLQAEQTALTTQKRSRAEVLAIVQPLLANWAAADTAAIARELSRATLGEPFQLDKLGLPLEAVKAALNDALASLPEGMATAQRLERLKTIAVELDELELSEEALVMSTNAERRPDARPEIILQA